MNNERQVNTTPNTMFVQDSTARRLLNDVSRRWSLLVLAALRDEPRRFGELNGIIGGISERMLSLTLQRLVRDRLVVHQQSPSAAHYVLTDAGRIIATQVYTLFDSIYQALDHLDAKDVKKDSSTGGVSAKD